MIKVDGNSKLAFDISNPNASALKTNKDFASALETAKKSKDGKKLYAACQDMEAVFLGILFQTMRKSIPQGGIIKQSFGEDVYQSMLYDEYAKQVSQTDSLGIAQMLFSQLSKQL